MKVTTTQFNKSMQTNTPLTEKNSVENIKELVDMLNDNNAKHYVYDAEQKKTYVISTSAIISAMYYAIQVMQDGNFEFIRDNAKHIKDPYLLYATTFLRKLNQLSASGRVQPPIKSLKQMYNSIYELVEQNQNYTATLDKIMEISKKNIEMLEHYRREGLFTIDKNNIITIQEEKLEPLTQLTTQKPKENENESGIFGKLGKIWATIYKNKEDNIEHKKTTTTKPTTMPTMGR